MAKAKAGAVRKPDPTKKQIVASNRKARHNYSILDVY